MLQISVKNIQPKSTMLRAMSCYFALLLPGQITRSGAQKCFTGFRFTPFHLVFMVYEQHCLFTRPVRHAWTLLAVFVAVLAFASCSAAFDKVGYEQATNLKTAVLSLMDQASKPYAAHGVEVERVRTELKKSEERAALIKNNKEVAAAWRELNNQVVGPFFSKWQRDNALNPVLVQESVRICSNSFDAILRAEEAKKKR
jgi:hypothetical protein